MVFYSFRNLVIAYAILIAVVLLILLFTFSNFRSQQKQLDEIEISREALQKLEPAMVNLNEFMYGLNSYIYSGGKESVNFFPEGLIRLKNDSLQIIGITDSDNQNKKDYQMLAGLLHEMTSLAAFILNLNELKGFDSARTELKRGEALKIASKFRTLVENVENNKRKILSKAYNKGTILARKTFVFTGVISGLLILALVISFIVSYKDISNRISYNQSLEKFRNALNNSADAVYIVDRSQMKYIDVNDSACTTTGYTREELLTMGPQHLRRLQTKEVLSQIYDDIIQSTLKKEAQAVKYFRKDGSSFDTEISMQAMKDGNKDILITVARDITERKKAEDQLKKFSEELEQQVKEKTAGYFALIDTVDGIVWEADAQTFQFSFVSKQAERLLGYPVEKWINEPTFWADHMHPDDKTWAVDYCIQSTLAKKPHEFEYRMITNDGLIVWLRDIVSVIVENDKAVQLRGIMVDITEQKKTEEEKQKSEEKYRTIIEQASDGIFISGPDTFIIDINNSGCSMLGYSKEELQKMKFTELIAPGNLLNNPIRFHELRDGNIALSERRLIRKDGSEFSVEISAKLLSDGRYQAFVRDITERKMIEAKLIEQEELLRLFVEHSPASLAMFDNNMRYIITSRRWMMDYNLGDQQLIGKSHYEIFPGIPQHWKDIHQHCLAGAIEKNDEDSFARADGSMDWVRWEIHPWYKASGDIGGIIMFTEVITERKKAKDALKESEERYKVLVENAPEALVVFDVENKNFVSVSESAIKLFGMPKEELLKIGPLELSPEYQPDGRLSAEACIENIKEAVSGNKPVFEWMHCDAHGKHIPCEVWLVRLPSEKHVLIRGSVIDITERKKAQNELEQSYRAIRQLTEHIQNIREEERIGIAREIHDELGQQLTVLKMDISWLEKKIDKDDIEVTQKINDLLKITDDTIRSVRKISSELRPSLLDDLGLVATMEWHLKEFEKRSGIKTSFIATEAEDELPGSIKTTLFRVFQESLTNVARHAEATNIKVSLKHKNNTCILNITDNGKGFDKQKIADKRTLGLLGMRERTAMTGGSYDIISTPGKGTTIIVAIPLIDI